MTATFSLSHHSLTRLPRVAVSALYPLSVRQSIVADGDISVGFLRVGLLASPLRRGARRAERSIHNS